VRLRKTSSGMDQGTFSQLARVIERTNIKKEPKDDFYACEDFVVLNTTCHILCVAMESLSMDSVNSKPHHELISDNIKTQSKEERMIVLSSISNMIVEKTVNLCMQYHDNDSTVLTDHIWEYAVETISLGLLYIIFRDAIREGDGYRVKTCWKYFIPIFKATGRRNYATEAFNMVADCKLLPPRQAHQLQWSRFVNTHGKGIPGNNKPCDLHIEHMNRLLKVCFHNLGANKTKNAISQYSKCMGPLATLLDNFDEEHHCSNVSGSHTSPSSIKDRDIIIKQLRENRKVFKKEIGRSHRSFPKFLSNPIRQLRKNEFMEWLKQCAKSKGIDLITS